MSAIPAAQPMQPVPRRVLAVHRETPDTVTLSLEGSSAEALPGQFNMLYAFAVGEVPVSLSGDPGRDGETVHTIKAIGAVSSALMQARKGTVIGVRGPFGRPWPLEEAQGKDLLLVAGGLGLAPLRPALYRALARRADYGRVTLLIGARTPKDLLYRSELARWGRRADVEVGVTVDRADAAWQGRIGVVPALLDGLAMNPERTVAFLCGPEVMMRFTLRELTRCGVTDERIFVSMERNMKCAIGLCGHCQLGPDFICKDGAVFRFDRLRPRFWLREY